MASDPQDDGFHEIQLSGKQLVFLFMATTVVSIVIFLCGVLIGRSVSDEASASGVPVDAEAGQPQATGIVTDASVPSPAETQPTSEADLTYPDRLAEAAPPPERLRSEEPAPPPAAEPKPSAGEAPVEQEAEPEPPPAPPEPKPTPKPEPPPAEPEPPARAEAEPAAPAAADADGGNWTVQVAALSKRDEAEAIARRLQGKGYLAFVVSPSSGGGTPMYRVRVGSYADRADAERTMRRLAEEERLKPWITR